MKHWEAIKEFLQNEDFAGAFHFIDNAGDLEEWNRQFYIAKTLLRSRHTEKALAAISKSIALKTEHPDLIAERGLIYFHLGRMEESLIDLDKALALEPSNPYRHSSRAYVKDRMGKTREAVEDYRRAVELDPDDAIALNNLGILEQKLGYMDMAKERFRKADGLGVNSKGELEEMNDEVLKPNYIKKDKPEDKFSGTSYWRLVKRIFTNKNERASFFSFLKGKKPDRPS